MTVIAYRSGLLAADTLIKENDSAFGHMHKIRRVSRVDGVLLLGAAGLCLNVARFLEDGANPEKLAGILQDMKGLFTGISILEKAGKTSITVFENGGAFDLMQADCLAIGSGADVARGAMHHGASAIEAVEAAIAWRTDCGGRIEVLSA